MSDFGKPVSQIPVLPGDGADAAAKPAIDRTYKMYYGGQQKRPDAPYVRAIKSADGSKVIGQVGEGNRKDLRNAVEAAHKAFPGWGKRAAHNRAQIVYYMAENLELRRDEVAHRIAAMTGQSMEDALKEVDASVERLFYWGAYADKYGGTVQETTLYGATVKIHEPVGPIGICCPDECPLLGFVSLFAPAVVRGNCIVIVPSERYPLAALDFYQVFDTSDLPGGVVNILTGERDHLAKYMAEHHDLEAVWYFGSRAGSQYVETAAAENIKRTWVNYGEFRDWFDHVQGAGEEFLYQAVECKNIWMPMGTIFAN
jgi:aldehyde dehydrogenase (NAD+)